MQSFEFPKPFEAAFFVSPVNDLFIINTMSLQNIIRNAAIKIQEIFSHLFFFTNAIAISSSRVLTEGHTWLAKGHTWLAKGHTWLAEGRPWLDVDLLTEEIQFAAIIILASFVLMAVILMAVIKWQTYQMSIANKFHELEQELKTIKKIYKARESGWEEFVNNYYMENKKSNPPLPEGKKATVVTKSIIKTRSQTALAKV